MTRSRKPDFAEEARWGGRVAGVDEAGRGPLAGPVVAAAVILDPARLDRVDGLADSKTLSADRRQSLFDTLHREAEIGVGRAEPAEIDRLNILQASLLAMARALAALGSPPDRALIDGPHAPRLALACHPVVKGDARCLSIAAASIVAKVTRDREMVELARRHPEYGWDRNFGYPTAEHRAALRAHGATAHHRRSFRPVAEVVSLTF